MPFDLLLLPPPPPHTLLQNVLENYSQFIVLLTLASVHRPTWAAAAGMIRLLGFIVYVKGYQVRNIEAFCHLFLINRSLDIPLASKGQGRRASTSGEETRGNNC